MCAKFRFSISSRCDDIVAEVKGATLCPPPCGWRVARRPSGCLVNVSIGSCEAAFSSLLVKVRSRSGQKDQISNFINVNKKVSLRCSLDIQKIWWCPLLCYASSETFPNMHLNYKHFHISRIQKNELLYKSAIFLLIRLRFSKLVHLDRFYNIYSIFSKKKMKKTFFYFVM